MTKRLLPLLALGLLAASPALAQSAFPTSRAPVGGATGAYSARGWSSGQAPTSDFDRQGAPMTRNQRIRAEAAAAARQQNAVNPSAARRPARRRAASR